MFAKLLSKVKQYIALYIKTYILEPLLIAPIKNKRDLVFKIASLCILSLCVLSGVVLMIINPNEMEQPIFWLLWICALPFAPKILVTTFRMGKVGYAIGKMYTKEYVDIQQVSDTQYRATHIKTHSGGVVAYMCAIFTFGFTSAIYMIIGPFMSGCKIYKTSRQLYDYVKADSGAPHKASEYVNADDKASDKSTDNNEETAKADKAVDLS